MGKTLEGRAVGAPDFIFIPQFRIHTIRSDKDQHFTGALAKNASEEENLTGLETNKIIITRISIRSKQQLKFRLALFSKDTFTDTDLDQDTLVASKELNLPIVAFWTDVFPTLFHNLSMEEADAANKLSNWIVTSGCKRSNALPQYIADGSYYMNLPCGSWGAWWGIAYQEVSGDDVTNLIGRRIKVGGYFNHVWGSDYRTELWIYARNAAGLTLASAGTYDTSGKFKYSETAWLTIPAGTTTLRLSCEDWCNAWSPSYNFDALRVEMDPTEFALDLKGLELPYEDLDKTKELHITLVNLSPTSKSAGVDGEVVIEVSYELAD